MLENLPFHLYRNYVHKCAEVERSFFKGLGFEKCNYSAHSLDFTENCCLQSIALVFHKGKMLQNMQSTSAKKGGTGIMDFYDVVKTRRSVRSYKLEPISDDVLNRVLNAARIAPSGGNRQPARFILVKDKERKQELVPLCNGQKFIAQAPIVVIACGQDIQINRGGYMGKLCMLIDVAIAVDHLTLAARAEGLGTCWIGSFKNNAIKQFLKIPETHQVVALTPLGYPDGNPFVETTNRLALERLVCEETWQF